jgi:hypothetical protein
VFVFAAFELTTSAANAGILTGVFLATLLTFELWGENIGAARFQQEQQEQQKRSTTNSDG